MKNLLKNKYIQDQFRYKSSDIDPGNIVSVVMKRSMQHRGQFGSNTIKVIKIDPSGSGRIVGKLIDFGFLEVNLESEKEVFFSVDQIYRNYTLDPIDGVLATNHKKAGSYEAQVFLAKYTKSTKKV